MFSHGKFWPKTFEPATIKKKKKKERTAPRQSEQPRAHSRRQTLYLPFTLHLQKEAFPRMTRNRVQQGVFWKQTNIVSEKIRDYIDILVIDRNDIHEMKIIQAALYLNSSFKYVLYRFLVVDADKSELLSKQQNLYFPTSFSKFRREQSLILYDLFAR